MKDYYATLGVRQTASQEEIKDAYRMLSKKYHPDLNEGSKFFEDMFKELQEAYEILGDPYKRGKYDFEKEHIASSNTTQTAQSQSTYTQTNVSQSNTAYTSPNSDKQYYQQQYANYQQNVQEKTANDVVYDLQKVRQVGIQKLAILVALALVGYFLVPKFMASISHSGRTKMRWGPYDSAMSAFILPLFYCGWTITTYIGRRIFSSRVIYAHVLFFVIRFVVKAAISFYLGFYCLPFFLIIFILFAVYPEIVNKFKPMRYFIN